MDTCLSSKLSSPLSEVTCSNALEAAMTALWMTTEKYIHHNDVQENDEMMTRMLHQMAAYCMVDARSQASADSLAEAKKVEVGKDNTKTFREIYQEIMEEKEKSLPNAKSHPKYKLYKKKVAVLTAKAVQQPVASADDDDEELVITQADVNTIDPITRQQMTSPVKNTKCGHSYDKYSITALFRNKKQQKCPYVGCPNRDFFTLQDLEEDFQLKQIIKQMVESQAQ